MIVTDQVALRVDAGRFVSVADHGPRRVAGHEGVVYVFVDRLQSRVVVPADEHGRCSRIPAGVCERADSLAAPLGDRSEPVEDVAGEHDGFRIELVESRRQPLGEVAPFADRERDPRRVGPSDVQIGDDERLRVLEERRPRSVLDTVHRTP